MGILPRQVGSAPRLRGDRRGVDAQVADIRQTGDVRARVRAGDGYSRDGRVRDVGIGEQGRHPHDGRDDARDDVMHQRRGGHGSHSRRRGFGDQLGGRETLARWVGERIQRGSHRGRLDAQGVGDLGHLTVAQSGGAFRDDRRRRGNGVDVRSNQFNQRGGVHEHGPASQGSALRGSFRRRRLGVLLGGPIFDPAKAPESFLEPVAFLYELSLVPPERGGSLSELAYDRTLGRVGEFFGLPFLAALA